MDREALLQRIAETLHGDARVRGAWLTGSTASGVDDDFSDIDILAVVSEADLQAVEAYSELIRV